MRRILPKRKNNFRIGGIILGLFLPAFLLVAPHADAVFFQKKKNKNTEKVVELDTAGYRVYYLAGAAEKKPELGEGDYCELQYKAVYQEDWVPDSNRLIQIDFLDKDGYIVTRDVVPDQNFNLLGEYYGYLWIRAGLEKGIKKAEVLEVIQKNKILEPEPETQPEKEAEPQPKPFNRKNYYEEKNPKLKEILKRKVLTETDIQEALSLTRPAGSASAAPDEVEKEKPEGEDGEVSLETSFT